jgi:hypothetical protein
MQEAVKGPCCKYLAVKMAANTEALSADSD